MCEAVRANAANSAAAGVPEDLCLRQQLFPTKLENGAEV